MPAEGRPLAARLAGLPIPHVLLSSFQVSPVDLAQHANEFPLVIYFYPGGSSSPDDGHDGPMMDAAQHRAFRDHHPDFVAHECRAIGISSQSEQAQQKSAGTIGISHLLLTDPELQLAQELELPTFTVDGKSWYQRLTLVASHGTIDKAFYPVPSAARSAAQAIAWMQVHGI